MYVRRSDVSVTKFSRSAMSLIVSTQAPVDCADANDAAPRRSNQLGAVELDKTNFIFQMLLMSRKMEMTSVSCGVDAPIVSFRPTPNGVVRFGGGICRKVDLFVSFGVRCGAKCEMRSVLQWYTALAKGLKHHYFV